MIHSKFQKVFFSCRETGQAQSHQPPKYFMTFHRLHDRYEWFPMKVIVHGLQAERSDLCG